MSITRSATAEAHDVLPAGWSGRVLEPSPPAIHDDEFFADDPVNAPVNTKSIVAPVNGDKTWQELVADKPELAAWAAERWLVPSQLASLPENLVAQRTALHRLATYVIGPARSQVNKKFGLRWTKGGFGTPFFGDDMQVRVAGDTLIVQEGTTARQAPITSLNAAAAFIGSAVDPETAAENDSPRLGDPDEDLRIDPVAVTTLSNWWGMATAALELLRADAATVEPSRVQLWPGHFDAAVDAGETDQRASYGASPGDANSDEPYLYISVWWPNRLSSTFENPYWNAKSYTGATLAYSELQNVENPVDHALAFYTQGHRLLAHA